MSEERPVGDEGPLRAARREGSSRVVVGVDGSESSLHALRWAARQATLMGVPLQVVTAWDFPERPAPLGIVAEVPWQDALMDEARSKLDEIVTATLADEPQPAHVGAEVIRGAPAQVLLDEVREGDLLVVGNRGRRALAEFLLGSVSERCVRHASCPVAVIR